MCAHTLRAGLLIYAEIPLGKGHGDANRVHWETGLVSGSSHVFPQSQVVRPKAVDRAIGQLNIDLTAQHAHPASAGSWVHL